MHPKAKLKINPMGNYINGRFTKPQDPNGEWEVKSPADYTDILGKVQYSYADIDRVVESAREAFKKWKKTPVLERVSLLKKYAEVLAKREADLVEAISREMGKPIWEAKTEVTAMIAKVGVTIEESGKVIQDFQVPEIMKGVLGTCRYRPMGVLAVVGPFNFPGHLSNGHIVPALLTGNTIIFKPSEKTPFTGQIMTECFAEAGFPAGVFNLLQGERETSRRLCLHEGLNGVLFTGSYEVGTRIKQDTLQQHWKLLALEMGGKNAAIVWEDADFNTAIRETLVGAFITSGQRCSATSRIIVHNSLVDKFITTFHERAKAFSISHPLDDPFMGPVIDESTVDRYMKFQGMATREGCEMIMRGKKLDLEYPGNYVTPSICRMLDSSIEAAKKSVYLQTEIFAPNVVITGTDDLDEAIGLANVTQYGLVTSVFTQNAEIYARCSEDLECGLINWNRSTVGASSRLPFGGLKKSGNHFPTALSAPIYCTHPVASLEVANPGPEKPSYPGLNWA